MERRSQNQYVGLDPDAVKLIRNVARRIARRRNGFGEDDRPDIEHELLIAVQRGLPRHDPERGEREALIARTVRNRARQLIRDRKAACRDCRRDGGSLQDPVSPDDADSDELGEQYDAVDYLRMTGDGLLDEERIMLALDIARAVAALPPELREVAMLLAAGLTDVEIARRLGIARSTLYLRLPRLRAAMHAAGLDDYLR